MATDSRDDTLANLLAYLDLRLDTDLERGLAEWQHAYHRARQDWQLQQAGQLLHQLKHYSLTPAQNFSKSANASGCSAPIRFRAVSTTEAQMVRTASILLR